MGRLITNRDTFEAGNRLIGRAFEVMSSPPTITVGSAGGASSITGAAIGSPGILVTNTAKVAWSRGTPNLASGAYASTTKGLASMCFIHVGRRFELVIQDQSQAGFSLLVDGKLAFTRSPKNFRQFQYHQVLVDFGADTETFYLKSASVTAGGTGYVVGDILTISGGTGTAATVLVAAVSGGAVTSVVPVTFGAYSVRANTTGLSVTGGTGSGATLSAVWASDHTTRIPRRIEVISGRNCYILGLNVDTSDIVLPWSPPTGLPKRVVVADSFADNIAGGGAQMQPLTFPRQMENYLNDCLNITCGYSGVGWVTTPISARLSDIVSLAPDRVALFLGTNDTPGQTASAVTAAVTANMESLMASLPRAIFTVVAAWEQDQTREDAIIAGVAALSDQTRVRGVRTLNMYANTTDLRASDTVGHPTPGGDSFLAYIAAELVQAAELSMLS